MTKYIIGTVSDMDAPLNPNAKGMRSMTAYMQGVELADIQKERNQVIDATQEDIRALKSLIESVLSDGAICAIGNEEKVNADKALFNNLEFLCN
jgi:Zn-dependent M16 (insulinase) family peptidase